MISTACYPYPVNDDKSSARRVALQPHIYSPSESHGSPRHAMYPHLQVSGCPSPSYIYSGYEQYYSKESWATAAPSSWPTFYPLPPRSSSLPEATVNPKVTILPPQSFLVSDIDTPSSISSHSVLTPSSPFLQHDVGEADFQAMEFDEFEGEDEEDYIDSDYGDEMEVIEEAPSPLYSASAPHVIKSTSALAGALGDAPLSSSYDSAPGVSVSADRKLSASVPGYASASHRSTASSHQRWPEKGHSPAPLTTSPHVHDASYPSQHMYTQRHYASSSSSLLAPMSPLPHNHISSSSSLAGAFASSTSSSSGHAPHRLPILQPQPIRPIPPIPLADLTSSANESSSSPEPTRMLSPLPLLCQPVSDAVRYQFKEQAANASGTLDDGDDVYAKIAPEPACEDLGAAPENDQFAPQKIAFCQQHQHHHHQPAGSCSTEEKMFSCASVRLPIRWQ